MKKVVLLVIITALCSACIHPRASLPEPIKTHLKVSFLSQLDHDGRFLPGTDFGFSQKIKVVSGNGDADTPFQCELTLNNNSKKSWEGIINIELSDPGSEARFFLPGFMYGTNQGHTPYNPALLKQFPRLRKGDIAPPYSPYWFVRSDQLTHPVAMMYTGEQLMGISGSPYAVDPSGEFARYNGFYCSIQEEPSVGYTVGHFESPGIYISPWDYQSNPETGKTCIKIGPDEQLVFPFEIYLFDAVQESDQGLILRNVYGKYHQAPNTGNKPETAIQDITRAIQQDAYGKEQHTFALISKQPVEGKADKVDGGKVRYALNNEKGDSYDYFFEGLIGWTNGTVIAVPLLMASYKTSTTDLRALSLEVIDHIVRFSVNPQTGLPFCTKVDGTWTNQGWWTEWVNSEGRTADHSSYIIGQTLYYLLKAYEIELNSGDVKHEDWLDFVFNILQIISRTQQTEGAFPRFWSEKDGSGSEYDAFSGCWVAAAMAYYTKITGDATFLNNSQLAESHYGEQVSRMECIKTPLDVADAPDSEGILAYIRLTKLLHQLSGDPGYLESLQSGLDYSFSYKFCYNVPIDAPPLDQINWSSSGGDITSVNNAVIHCMSNTILDEIQYCYDQTGDSYYKSRLEDTYLWGLQAYNRTENEFFFGKQGWSTEYFCQSNRFVLDIRLTDNTRSNIWFAYHPWATASILEGLCSEVLPEQD